MAKRAGKHVGKVWQLQDAKSRLGEVVQDAEKHGLVNSKGSLVDFLTASPLSGAELDVARSKDPGRAVDL